MVEHSTSAFSTQEYGLPSSVSSGYIGTFRSGWAGENYRAESRLGAGCTEGYSYCTVTSDP